MINKKLLYETLKKEMDAKKERKALQQKLRRIENKTADPIAKEEEKFRRKTVAELQEEDRKAGIAKRQVERQKAKENKITTTIEAKPKIMNLLKKLYEDPDTGFGSQQELFDQARADKEYGNFVTKSMVKEFFDEKGKTKAPLKDYKGYNSWVSNLPREQYQVDVGYINKGITEELARDGWFMVCIDVFSKRAEVEKLEAVSSEQTELALRKCIDAMGFPKEIYCDQGTEFTSKLRGLCDKESIKLITTRSYARFAERFIRWVKMQLARRKELGSWKEQLPKIVKKWNSTKNSVTGLTPLEAHKDENALETKLGITMHAKFDRKYPDLKIGDMVRIRKKKGKLEKETVPYWSDEVYKVVNILHGSQYEPANNKMSSTAESYVLLGLGGQFFMRHELMKV